MVSISINIFFKSQSRRDTHFNFLPASNLIFFLNTKPGPIDLEHKPTLYSCIGYLKEKNKEKNSKSWLLDHQITSTF